MQKQYGVGSIVFDKWTIKRKIGEGSFGKVFEIQREDFGEVYKAALKVITVPQSQAEVQSAMEEGMTRQQAEEYFYGVVEDIVREFAIMAKLKGTANVVGYEDHAVIRHADGVGWDILIRMELLNPLLPYAYAHPFARRDIIRLGIDICRALELCQKYNVIHRDIKPENIFVSDNGDFKLGDFGIARTIDRTMSGLSKKGTYNYMAPEVYRGAEYGFSVDIYSLGIVLYRLLNKNRVPFLPPPPEPITHTGRELALAKRMGGEALPAPIHARGRLAEIVEKACAFDPKERYSTPAQMRQELEAILYDAADAELIYPDGDELALMENQYASYSAEKEHEQEDWDEEEQTESMFGGAGGRDGLDQSRTESMFSRSVPAEEGTSKTESIFSAGPTKAAKKGPGPVAVKQPANKKKGAVIAAVAALAVLAAGAGGLFLSRQNTQKAQQYTQLMEQGMAACQSDPQTALELFRQAEALLPDQTNTKVSYAYGLYCCGEYEACITYIEDDLALGKAYDIAVQSQLSEILGAAYFEQEDYAQAASFFRLSTAGGDITVSAQRDYAVSLAKLKDFDAADAVLQQMVAAGADDIITQYVQAEVAYAREEYPAAEEGFLSTLNGTSDAKLQARALRSLAQLYRDCAVLARTGSSPIDAPAAKEAQLLAGGIVEYGLTYDTTLWEMLAMAYFEAYHTDPDAPADYLTKAAECFHRVIEMGVQKEYLYSNLYAICYEQKDYTGARQALADYEAAFPDSYMPHALRGMMLITIENGKSQSARNYSAALKEYETAGTMVRSGDDTTYYQQLGSLIDSLRQGGWL